MLHPANLRIEDYTYHLPQESIATYPLPQRDKSKLLVYEDGEMQVDDYAHIAHHIPKGMLMVFNQTKVVQARLVFTKPTGGAIEVFCLEPHQQYADIQIAMMQTKKVWWQCMVGGAAKWKDGMVLHKVCGNFELTATIIERLPSAFTIELSWGDNKAFAEVLSIAGKIPLPPYLHREAEETDSERYQTIYAKEEGSVAAPTAGLHFTDAVMVSLKEHDIQTDFVTLHVGAGTFKPVKTATMQEHDMHAEWIDVTLDLIKNIIAHWEQGIVAVGTTSLRTLESLYWIGAELLDGRLPNFDNIAVPQWLPYTVAPLKHTPVSALQAVVDYLLQKNQHRLVTRTQILIAPGYTFKIVKGLVTNFHQPQSTLLLLVAALIGNEWKTIYDYALKNNFRFLSYGDGSLLWAK